MKATEVKSFQHDETKEVESTQILYNQTIRKASRHDQVDPHGYKKSLWLKPLLTFKRALRDEGSC